jgi:hypothetical protein
MYAYLQILQSLLVLTPAAVLHRSPLADELHHAAHDVSHLLTRLVLRRVGLHIRRPAAVRPPRRVRSGKIHYDDSTLELPSLAVSQAMPTIES